MNHYSNKKNLLKVRDIVIFLFMAILFVGLFSRDSSTAEEKAKERKKSNYSSIIEACRQFINRQLNDPGSAQYDRFNRSSFEKEKGIWVTTLNLRAKNAYGAYINTRLTCTIRDNGKDFSLISIV